MSGAFVAWLGPKGEDRDAVARRIAAIRRARPGLETIAETASCMIMAQGLPLLVTGKGVVLGRLHALSGKADRVSDRTSLIDRFWGGYVAVFETREGAELLRAPLGDLPCYWSGCGDGIVAASSPRLLLDACGREPHVAWDALARRLAFGTISTGETCLEGVRDLRGGDRLTTAAAQVRCETDWSPWVFARGNQRTGRTVPDPSELRRLVLDGVDATTSGHAHVLLKLSGGLDSSIVAAALTAASRSFSGLTLFTDDPDGDERDYARIVAAHLGLTLIEARRDPLRLDLDKSPSAGLARPSFPGFRQEADRIADAAAAEIGATAVVDGGGGDNVFCSLQSAAAVADCLVDWRGLPALGRTARSLASIAQVSLAHVVRRAAIRAWSPRRTYRWELGTLFLSDAALASVPAQPDHPWLTAPPHVPPGRAAHVALIAAAQSYVEGLDSDRDPPTLAPLLAQPIVEYCLAVPSWQWFDRGLTRAFARRAFAADLPAAIIGRRSKGSPECFVAQSFEVHRSAIRERLLGGRLAEAGLIDLPALADALDTRRPPLDWSLDRIMILLDAEIWARAWST